MEDQSALTDFTDRTIPTNGVLLHVIEAGAAAADMLSGKMVGEAGARVVIEECLQGDELSFLVLSDGERVAPLVAARGGGARRCAPARRTADGRFRRLRPPRPPSAPAHSAPRRRSSRPRSRSRPEERRRTL